MLPLTSLGEANMAPIVIVIPMCNASNFTPTIMGMVSAIPKRMALEKSVLLKNPERSLMEVDKKFFETFTKDWL